MSLTSSELILNADGSIYHLALKPTEVAEKIVFVGDPDRVDAVSRHFDDIFLTRQKREFRTVTGAIQGERVSVISTGIGTDNIDIVLTEIDALCNIDFQTKTVKDSPKRLQILRLGTTGSVQADLSVDSLVLSRYALGADGLMAYYEHQPSLAEAGLWEAWHACKTQLSSLPPELYLATGAACFWQAAEHQGIRQGITFTAKGFYGPQGRSLGRVPLQIPDLVDQLMGFSYGGFSVTNIEMETAGILGLGHVLGHEMGSLSVVLANRALGTFSTQPAQAVDHLIEVGLRMLLDM